MATLRIRIAARVRFDLYRSPCRTQMSAWRFIAFIFYRPREPRNEMKGTQSNFNACSCCPARLRNSDDMLADFGTAELNVLSVTNTTIITSRPCRSAPLIYLQRNAPFWPPRGILISRVFDVNTVRDVLLRINLLGPCGAR